LKKKSKIFSFIFNNILKILFLFFIIWLFFFDENAFLRQVKLNGEINKQKKEIERLRLLIKNDSTLISILKSDTLNPDLEKIFREDYLLSKPNETIYIIEK
tara:strand:+ start:1576 stop:1878 length:303 start_codon:yes stop_codon:yes gene_type:complete